MAQASSNAFRVEIASWIPPYALPTAAGQVVKIGNNRAVDVALPGWGEYFTNFNLRVSFGAGVMQTEFSPGGAYVWAGNGGHAHPDHAGATLFDYTDALWKRLDHSHPGRQVGDNANTKGFTLAVMNGAPHYEITDTIFTDAGVTYAVPGPVHPYTMLAPWPSSLGGGSKGGVIYVTRATMGETGQTHSPSTHGFDLNTRRWRRFSMLHPYDIASGRYEGSVVYDAARGRYWLWHEDQHLYQYLSYLRVSDWTWQLTTPNFNWLSDELSAAGRAWMYQGFLFVQGTNGSLWGFNPDNVAAGFVRITVNGGPLPDRINSFVHYPPTNKFYYYAAYTANNVLYRLTPPASNPLSSAWTLDTRTLSMNLPDCHPTLGHYNILHYVPSIQRLSWFGKVDETGGNVYLIKPE